MSKKNEPAFPIDVPASYGTERTIHTGVTKREYFAALILQGLSVPCIPGPHNTNDGQEIAHKTYMAVKLADALLEELGK
jgi:hypothetical protein